MIQAPVTTNSVDTTKRQKQCHLVRRRERLMLLTQPMIPPTRKAIATITVTQAEAIHREDQSQHPEHEQQDALGNGEGPQGAEIEIGILKSHGGVQREHEPPERRHGIRGCQLQP